jgi:hypothetical protein
LPPSPAPQVYVVDVGQCEKKSASVRWLHLSSDSQPVLAALPFTGSLHGTQLNGIALSEGVEKALKDGDTCVRATAEQTDPSSADRRSLCMTQSLARQDGRQGGHPERRARPLRLDPDHVVRF